MEQKNVPEKEVANDYSKQQSIKAIKVIWSHQGRLTPIYVTLSALTPKSPPNPVITLNCIIS